MSLRIGERLHADLGYRFLDSRHHNWSTETGNSIQIGPVHGRYAEHALTLGFRYLAASGGR